MYKILILCFSVSQKNHNGYTIAKWLKSIKHETLIANVMKQYIVNAHI